MTAMSQANPLVMPGLEPGISRVPYGDGRVKPGHDDR
jgi:hypothetical protein